LARRTELIRINGACLLRFVDTDTSTPREVLMRLLALATLTIFMGLTVAPAVAQTYSGNYPICLQLYLRDGARSIDCAYSSIEQCQATASGLSAMCVTNPYYSNAREPAYRQPRRGY